MDESRTRVTRELRYLNGSLYSQNSFTSVRERHGVDNPRWRQRIKNRQDATTAFQASWTNYRGDFLFSLDATVYILSPVTGYVIDKSTTSMSGNWMRFTSIANPTSLTETEANNQALKYFVERASAVQRSFRGLTNAGELGEALRMIRNPAKALRKGLDDYLDLAKKRAIKASRNSSKNTKQGRRKSPSSVRRALSDTWLENSFGWQPLLGSIDDGAKALARLNYHQYQPIERVSARGQSHILSEASGSNFAHGAAEFTSRERTMQSVEIQYKAGVKCSVPNARPARELGFTPSEFIPTAWELLPWSFVADYFTNIGDIIDGYAFHVTSLAWCAKTVRKRALKTSIDPRGACNISGGYVIPGFVYFRPGKPSLERKTVNRTAFAGTFVPDFQFELPGMGTKWINLAALSNKSQSFSKVIRRL